jgi:hypothetical protein
MLDRMEKLVLPIAIFMATCAGAVTERPSTRRAATQPADTQSAAMQPAASQPLGRILLQQNFEAERGGWSGKIITDNVPPGSRHALAAVPTETHWARRATVNFRGRGSEHMVLKFRYYISKDIPLTIYIFDRTQKDNLRYDLKTPVAGKWTDVQVNMNADLRRNDGSSGKLKVGDTLNGISFLSGRTGVDECDLAVDDVEIVALD